MVSNTLTEAEAETLNNTLVNVKPKALIDTLTEPLLQVNTKTLGDTFANVKVVALVER